MAQKTQITLIDDIDGSTADETVTFALDGVSYEIDLNGAHASELRDTISGYVGHARKIAGRTSGRTGSRSRSAGRDYEPATVREWAASRGIDIPARGRIPSAVLDQYRATR